VRKLVSTFAQRVCTGGEGGREVITRVGREGGGSVIAAYHPSNSVSVPTKEISMVGTDSSQIRGHVSCLLGLARYKTRAAATTVLCEHH